MNSFPTEIIHLGVNRWDSMMQREQHLMMGLSRSYRILFVDPPLSFLTLLLGRMGGKRRGFRSRLRWVNDRLIVYTPPAFPPFSQKSRWVLRLNRDLLISLIKSQLERLSFKNFILGVAYPLWGEVVRALRPGLSYYDCSDEYVSFPGLGINRRMFKELEEELLTSVDLVFCSSQALKESKAGFNRNCFLIPNGVDLTPQGEDQEKRPPTDLTGIRKPILGYVGTMGEWLDLDALIDLARSRPDWSIVLVGPATSKRLLSAFGPIPNIYWLGEKAYHKIALYLRGFDVCLIPFKMNDFTKRIYPTKFHEYLAAGKPVVSSPLPDLIPFRPWVEFYSDSKEMAAKVEHLLKEDSEEKALARRKVAGENTWGQRVETMMQILERSAGERMGQRERTA